MRMSYDELRNNVYGYLREQIFTLPKNYVKFRKNSSGNYVVSFKGSSYGWVFEVNWLQHFEDIHIALRYTLPGCGTQTENIQEEITEDNYVYEINQLVSFMRIQLFRLMNKVTEEWQFQTICANSGE